MSLKLGIVGHPLGHTLSPLLHDTLLKAFGLTGKYGVYQSENLPHTLQQLMWQHITGFNVTIPYKVAMVAYCTQLTPMARMLQAVNTVTRQGDCWHGDNTDAPGYWAGLPANVQHSINQRRVTVLGAGGSARAVVATLIEQQADAVTLISRRTEAAYALAQQAEDWRLLARSQTRLQVLPWAQLQDLSTVDMLVNTTPVGMQNPNACPIDPDMLHSLPPEAYVSDLIYKPLETQLVAEAKAAGYLAEGGLGMLVNQGVLAFAQWAKLSAPVPQVVVKQVRNTLQLALTGVDERDT
jgi:shikimate dehydrogenase